MSYHTDHGRPQPPDDGRREYHTEEGWKEDARAEALVECYWAGDDEHGQGFGFVCKECGAGAWFGVEKVFADPELDFQENERCGLCKK